jgi:predicted dehydrogenase
MDGVNVDVTPAMPEKKSAYFREIEYFVRCVRGEAKVLVKPEEALSVQKVIDAIYKSSETGREIAIR